jgi:hypothetical protein
VEEYKVVLGLGALAAYLIKFLQGSKYFPWISAEAKKITFVVQAMLSLLATIGIGYTWDAQNHSLLITGLSLAAIFHGAIGWISQFAIQHGFTNLITIGQKLDASVPAVVVPAESAVPGNTMGDK